MFAIDRLEFGVFLFLPSEELHNGHPLDMFLNERVQMRNLSTHILKAFLDGILEDVGAPQ